MRSHHALLLRNPSVLKPRNPGPPTRADSPVPKKLCLTYGEAFASDVWKESGFSPQALAVHVINDYYARNHHKVYAEKCCSFLFGAVGWSIGPLVYPSCNLSVGLDMSVAFLSFCLSLTLLLLLMF